MHVKLLQQTLEALSKLVQVAVIHVPGHVKESTMEAKSNRCTDMLAKKAAISGKPIQWGLDLRT